MVPAEIGIWNSAESGSVPADGMSFWRVTSSGGGVLSVIGDGSGPLYQVLVGDSSNVVPVPDAAGVGAYPGPYRYGCCNIKVHWTVAKSFLVAVLGYEGAGVEVQIQFVPLTMLQLNQPSTGH